MKNQGIRIGDKLYYLCYHNPRKKKYDIANGDFKVLILDMFEGKNKVFDYKDDCLKNIDRYNARKLKRDVIWGHFNNRPCDISYIKTYCDFFGCSSDYLLGYIDRPTRYQVDVGKITGLSDNAIRNLIKADKKEKVFCNAFIESGVLSYFVGSLNVYSDIIHSDVKEICSISSADEKRKIGKTILENSVNLGHEQILNSLASDCFRQILQDDSVMKYLLNEHLIADKKDSISFYKKLDGNSDIIIKHFQDSIAELQKEQKAIEDHKNKKH